MPRASRQNPWNEVVGLAALGIGTVVFLALISYNPGDVPPWIWFSKTSSNAPVQNFIGPTGAVLAGFLCLTLGAAPYLLSSLLLGFGIAKLLLSGFRISTSFHWAFLFMNAEQPLTTHPPRVSKHSQTN